jgi:hypothetical protein
VVRRSPAYTILAVLPAREAEQLVRLQEAGPDEAIRADGFEPADLARRPVSLLWQFDVPTKPNC